MHGIVWETVKKPVVAQGHIHGGYFLTSFQHCWVEDRENGL